MTEFVKLDIPDPRISANSKPKVTSNTVDPDKVMSHIKKQTPNRVNSAINPNYYVYGDIEMINIIDALTIGLTPQEAIRVSHAVEYLGRWKRKNGVEDLEKARWYINSLIDLVKGE